MKANVESDESLDSQSVIKREVCCTTLFTDSGVTTSVLSAAGPEYLVTKPLAYWPSVEHHAIPHHKQMKSVLPLHQNASNNDGDQCEERQGPAHCNSRRVHLSVRPRWTLAHPASPLRLRFSCTCSMSALRHFRAISDFSAAEIRVVLQMGLRLKSVPRAEQADILRGWCVRVCDHWTDRRVGLRTHTLIVRQPCWLENTHTR